jgi:hypothetical protein
MGSTGRIRQVDWTFPLSLFKLNNTYIHGSSKQRTALVKIETSLKVCSVPKIFMLQGLAERIWAMTLMSLIRQPQVFTYVGVICRCGHQIETCPDVAFPCCVKKGSEIRRVQYARCYVRYLRLRVNISAYRFYRLSMQFSVRAVDNRNRQVLSALRLRKNWYKWCSSKK